MSTKIKIKDLLNLQKLEAHSEKLNHYFEKGGTWKELLGFDAQAMEAQYAVAHQFYQNGDYQKAIETFSYLTVIDPYNYIYWMGLGMSRQHERNFQEAIVAYTMAAAVSYNHPQPHLQLAQCFHAIEQTEMVKIHLKKTIEGAAKYPEHEHLAATARQLLENLR